MKRTCLLAGLVVLFVATGASPSFAQSADDRDRARAEKMLASLESKIALDEAQKEKARDILVRNQTEFRAEREAAKGDKLLLFRLAYQRLKKIDDELLAILRPDQKSGYEAAKEELRQAMRERAP